jgi:hypothetical protein
MAENGVLTGFVLRTGLNADVVETGVFGDVGVVEKDHFNRKALKVVAKDTKLKHCKYVLCDLGESR